MTRCPRRKVGELPWLSASQGLLNQLLDRVAAFMGSSRIEQVRLPSLWLGSVQMTARVFVKPGKTDGLPEAMDGMLGPRAMNIQRIILDFEERTFRFR